MDNVAIVGGGIGGLVAALALIRRGIDVDVYEQAPELRELGAGVQISANGRTWRTVATVKSRSARLTDTVSFSATRVRAVRLRLIGGTGVRTVKTKTAPSTPILPMVQELTVR